MSIIESGTADKAYATAQAALPAPVPAPTGPSATQETLLKSATNRLIGLGMTTDEARTVTGYTGTL